MMSTTSRLTVQPQGDELLYWFNGECIYRHANDRSFPINVIKAIREHGGLPLKIAKDIWDARVTDSVAPQERFVRDAAKDLLIAARRLTALVQWIRSIDCAGPGIDLGETMNREASEAVAMAAAALDKAEGR